LAITKQDAEQDKEGPKQSHPTLHLRRRHHQEEQASGEESQEEAES
jgi:hypothetical protein